MGKLRFRFPKWHTIRIEYIPKCGWVKKIVISMKDGIKSNLHNYEYWNE